jgi:hypothetical protein
VKPVEIVLKEGPVRIPSLAGSSVDNTYSLWDEISASEFFPGHVESAFYFLTLRKSVRDVDEVPKVEAKLLSALNLLSTIWPFAGGSFMVLETRELGVSNRFESNAERVRSELLAEAGKTMVTSRVTVPYEVVATYERPPLEAASIIAKAANRDPGLRQLLAYHQAAWLGYYCRPRKDQPSWFIDLYKVRDLFVKLYGDERRAQADLGIANADWDFFGRILNNNDLRHAEVTGKVPPVPRPDVDRLYALAREWTRQRLKQLGLAVQ